MLLTGLPWWLGWYRICLQCRRPRFDPWDGKIPWRREWQPTPVFLPGEFSRQRVEHDWVTNTHTHTHTHPHTLMLTSELYRLKKIKPPPLEKSHWNLKYGLCIRWDREDIRVYKVYRLRVFIRVAIFNKYLHEYMYIINR